MKKVIVVVLLVAIAGIAGIVRSRTSTSGGIRNWSQVVDGDKSSGEAREEIRKSYDLSPGARVEVTGINGGVKIETSDSRTAEVYVERVGNSQEVLSRRKVTIDATADSLTVRADNADTSFFTRIFGSKPSERVTLRLPRAVSLVARGINGSVIAGEIDGAVEVKGVNGKVDIAQASGAATFKGINGNIAVGLSQIDKGGVNISGINGNIELRVNDNVNATLEAHGMNGNVVSDLPNVPVDKNRHGSYSAQIGSGENSINAHGINGNIHLTRMITAETTSAESKTQS
ncbi:MAG: hypothetical protein ABJB61_11570 [bacterium]